ncbi:MULTISPECIES: hypothetical protein [Pectobacterium]|uniref:MafI family immunity protein n=1 Tax=Pectobacterium aquaticum TaxID=2204145 RepID=A0A3R8NBF4_9GAMM|nr:MULTISPECIES: hypothetical protein [Pectobacterium]RRO02044.1 hypothetical protein DMB81_019920 [Pectobacterium aquaticum]RRO02075.1 hypothetical protein DMB85_020385 [Pectobacterium aquaticum]
MKNDIYSLSRELAESIKGKGEKSDFLSEEIISAINYGNSSGEILMKLRFLLNGVVSNQNEYEANVVVYAEKILNEISFLIK